MLTTENNLENINVSENATETVTTPTISTPVVTHNTLDLSVPEELELLRELCLTFGPSGCEENVADLIKSKIQGYYDELKVDRLYNVIAKIKGRGKNYNTENPKKLMFSAHMDEVGFMITKIDDEGYLYVSTVGGIDTRVICGRRVKVGNEKGVISGVLGSKAIHHQTEAERGEVTPIKSIYIDIGASNKEDAQKYVSVGDFATFDSDFILFGQDKKLMKSKAIDDRLGCTIMIDIMKRIKEENLEMPFDVYFAFSVREEIGLSGSVVAANKIQPDYCIVLESTAIADLSDVKPNSRVAEVGSGGALSLADRSTIYNRQFVDFALETGKKHDVKVQIKKYISGGNDAGHIHKSGSGVKTIALSAPTRYLHSASNVASVEDYKSIRELCYLMLKDFDTNSF